MKKLSIAFVFMLLMLATACSTSPEKYFDSAVLGINFISQTGTEQLKMLLAQEPMDYFTDQKNPKKVPYEKYVALMTVPYVERNLKSINGLSETKDTKEMLEASKKLHTYVLRLYKEEYPKIGALKDRGVSREELEDAMDAFDEKYGDEFHDLYQKVFDLGMAYAKANNLNVKAR